MTSIPKKSAVMILSSYCRDEGQANLMKWLCSKTDTGKSLWSHFIESQRLGIAEILFLFDSCVPPLSALLSVLTPMPPRYYSIASSPLSCKNSLQIAFSIVQYTCGVSVTSSGAAAYTSDIHRKGLCTHYLKDLSSRWIHPTHTHDDDKPVSVRIFLKPTISFHLPGSVAPPLILIGPGTGVAPFVGFLDHRAHLEKERSESIGDEMCCGVWRGSFELEEKDLPPESNQVGSYIKSVVRGAIFLFFGCRCESDYLYKQELEHFRESGTLTVLDVAMSRVGPEKVYVTHMMKARGHRLAKLIIEEGAYIYICGDGNQMAKDVGAAVKFVLCEHGGLNATQADELIEEMKHRRRYVMDVWS